jgi:hypothetical protein
MAEHKFLTEIYLYDSEICNGCPFVSEVPSGNELLPAAFRCNLFKKFLEYDVRRRIGRLGECYIKYGPKI